MMKSCKGCKHLAEYTRGGNFCANAIKADKDELVLGDNIGLFRIDNIEQIKCNAWEKK